MDFRNGKAVETHQRGCNRHFRGVLVGRDGEGRRWAGFNAGTLGEFAKKSRWGRGRVVGSWGKPLCPSPCRPPSFPF